MTPTRFSDLNQLLTDLTTSVRLRLGDNFVGVYLQGSFAVGDADEDSDVDFMVAIVHSARRKLRRSPRSTLLSTNVKGIGRSISKAPTCPLPPCVATN